MGLISHDWSEVQNAYLRSLGTKISRVIWISALIRKLWDTAWDIWNFRNHTLHDTDAPPKMEILSIINTRVSRHFNIGISGLTIRCHFLFKANTHTLLSRPVRQRLLWIAAVSSSCQCYQINLNRKRNLLETDQFLLIRIHSS